MTYVIKLYVAMLVAIAVVVFVLKRILLKKSGESRQAAQTKTCPSGHKNSAAAKFCQECGTYIEIFKKS